MSQAADPRRQALVKKFIELASDRVVKMSVAWVELEQQPDNADTAAELLRELHTLKGEAKALGFDDLTRLTHGLETYLFKARDNGWQVAREASDVVLGGIDLLGTLLAGLPRASNAPAVDEFLTTLSNVTGIAPPPPSAKPSASAEPAAVPSAPAPSPQKTLAQAKVLRIDADRLAAISDKVADILISQAKSSYLFRMLRDELDAAATLLGEQGQRLRAIGADFDELVYAQRLALRELDGTVRELRLVPVSLLLEPHRRSVRDLAASVGKEATLQVQGADVEMDKRVLETLEEPLVHILRNAIDHGLETPDERRRAGKPAQGTLTIEVHQRGGELHLVITDDGRGMDPAHVRKKAVQKGLLRAEDADRLSDAQALDLVFLAGFSTRDQATELSGRGIGMDVVKSRVEQLGGRVRLSSVLGRGTRLDLHAPMAIALTPCFLAQVGTAHFAVPSASIDAVVTVTSENLVLQEDRFEVRLPDNSQVPLQPLASVTGVLSTSGPRTGGTCMVVHAHGRRRAFLLERGGREDELFVKPLGPPLRKLAQYVGAAVLENGSLALVLDPSELVNRAEASTRALAAPTRRGKILVVDDSPVLRDVFTDIVQRLGHEVRVAEDGLLALEALDTFTPDVVITDLDMPRMNGFELIRKVREASTVPSVPIVVVSSRSTEEDRTRAMSLGANRYLVKNEGQDHGLAEALQSVLT
jgi:chemotaxis protein histidine kinase CheA/CheY-like chemotaxis protein